MTNIIICTSIYNVAFSILHILTLLPCLRWLIYKWCVTLPSSPHAFFQFGTWCQANLDTRFVFFRIPSTANALAADAAALGRVPRVHFLEAGTSLLAQRQVTVGRVAVVSGSLSHSLLGHLLGTEITCRNSSSSSTKQDVSNDLHDCRKSAQMQRKLTRIREDGGIGTIGGTTHCESNEVVSLM